MNYPNERFLLLWCLYLVFLFLSWTMFVSRDGIRFAFRDPEEGEEQYPSVSFLEILSEFSFKLLQDDRSKL